MEISNFSYEIYEKPQNKGDRHDNHIFSSDSEIKNQAKILPQKLRCTATATFLSSVWCTIFLLGNKKFMINMVYYLSELITCIILTIMQRHQPHEHQQLQKLAGLMKGISYLIGMAVIAPLILNKVGKAFDSDISFKFGVYEIAKSL